MSAAIKVIVRNFSDVRCIPDLTIECEDRAAALHLVHHSMSRGFFSSEHGGEVYIVPVRGVAVVKVS